MQRFTPSGTVLKVFEPLALRNRSQKMSKNETWRTRKYWSSVGGLLIEEFHAIRSDVPNNISKRAIDGVIVLGEVNAIQVGGNYDFKGKDIIVVQTKSNRLGMYLMGQAYYSGLIMKRFEPRSIKAVAICGKSDAEMEKLCEESGVEVLVLPDLEYVDPDLYLK